MDDIQCNCDSNKYLFTINVEKLQNMNFFTISNINKHPSLMFLLFSSLSCLI